MPSLAASYRPESRFRYWCSSTFYRHSTIGICSPFYSNLAVETLVELGLYIRILRNRHVFHQITVAVCLPPYVAHHNSLYNVVIVVSNMCTVRALALFERYLFFFRTELLLIWKFTTHSGVVFRQDFVHRGRSPTASPAAIQAVSHPSGRLPFCVCHYARLSPFGVGRCSSHQTTNASRGSIWRFVSFEVILYKSELLFNNHPVLVALFPSGGKPIYR